MNRSLESLRQGPVYPSVQAGVTYANFGGTRAGDEHAYQIGAYVGAAIVIAAGIIGARRVLAG